MKVPGILRWMIDLIFVGRVRSAAVPRSRLRSSARATRALIRVQAAGDLPGFADLMPTLTLPSRCRRAHWCVHALIALSLLLAGNVPGHAQTAPGAIQTPGGAADRTVYTIRIAGYDNRSVEVSAHFVLADSLLLMYPEGADHVPESWATYVRNLAATDDAGRPVSLRYLGHAQWSVPAPQPAAINLRYEVVVHHDAGTWPFGSKEAAYAREDCVFLTGKALFIAQYQTADATVQVVLPQGWSVATPWADAPGGDTPAPTSEVTPGTPTGAPTVTRSFAVPNVYELLEVGMLIGKHLERTIRSGEVAATFAVGRDLASALDLFDTAMRPLVPAAAAVFGGTPKGKFVVIANRDTYDGGTSFTRSFDIVFRDAPTIGNRENWGHVITHEFLHLWNGNMIRPADGTQEYWFSEGFTDYLANLLEVQTGMITRRQLLDRLGEHYDKYLVAHAAAPSMSLRAAGDQKAQYYDLVYSGGLLTAFTLDVELQQRSSGRYGVRDLFRTMYYNFGTAGKSYTAADVQRAASDLAGADLAPFFAQYVAGTAPLPVLPALSALGLEVRRIAQPAGLAGGAATHITVPSGTARSAEARALAERVLGGEP